jgi:hypothetical protein
VAAEQSSGQPWRVQIGTAERGNRTGAGGEGRVEVDQAGGGATAAAQRRRQGALHRRQGAARAQRGPEEEERRKKILGTSR